jgi:hypothetical protein
MRSDNRFKRFGLEIKGSGDVDGVGHFSSSSSEYVRAQILRVGNLQPIIQFQLFQLLFRLRFGFEFGFRFDGS